MTEVLHGLFNDEEFFYDAAKYKALKSDKSKVRELNNFEEDVWAAFLRPTKGNTMMTPELLGSIDTIFRNEYHQDMTLLRCIGTNNSINKTALKHYRQQVNDLLIKHASDRQHPDLTSFKMKIDWLFDDDMKGRRLLPLLTVSTLEGLGEVFGLTPE